MMQSQRIWPQSALAVADPGAKRSSLPCESMAKKADGRKASLANPFKINRLSRYKNTRFFHLEYRSGLAIVIA